MKARRGDPVCVRDDAAVGPGDVDGTFARLLIGKDVVAVSWERLADILPLFEPMSTVSQLTNEVAIMSPIRLQGDQDHLAHFAWYLTADPFGFEQFEREPPSSFKCKRYIAIATVAHKYESIPRAEWAMRKVFTMLETQRDFPLDVKLLVDLLRLAALWKHDARIEANLLTRARDIWCDALFASSRTKTSSTSRTIADCSGDPIAILLAAKREKDMYLQGHAYFYVLQLGEKRIDLDKRLKGRDRRRLICGDLKMLRRTMFPRRESPPSVCSSPRSWEQQRIPDSRATSPQPSLVELGAMPSISAPSDDNWHSSWQPRVHNEILDCRDELWAIFSIPPWSLDDK